MLTHTALIASVALSMVSAGVSSSNGLDAAHSALQASLRANGVTVRTVTKGTGGPCNFAEGYFVSKDREIGICLEEGQTTFTAENLDTLRHEAIHVVQDCRGFRLGDNALKAGEKLDESYQLAGLNGFDLDRALIPYVRLGADFRILELEAEAITGAALRPAEEIAAEVSSVCGASSEP